jgi:hypothetical protein
MGGEEEKRALGLCGDVVQGLVWPRFVVKHDTKPDDTFSRDSSNSTLRGAMMLYCCIAETAAQEVAFAMVNRQETVQKQKAFDRRGFFHKSADVRKRRTSSESVASRTHREPQKIFRRAPPSRIPFSLKLHHGPTASNYRNSHLLNHVSVSISPHIGLDFLQVDFVFVSRAAALFLREQQQSTRQ